ncbi:MAG: dihydropyrimidinase [Myxococcota bacterium]
MKTLIRGGTVLTATDTYVADVLVDGESISTIGAHLNPEQADKVVDAAGAYVIPGGIDVHTHLDMPFGGTTTADDFASGTRGAAIGGTTSFVDFAIQGRGQTLQQGLDTWHKKADGKCAVDYAFHLIMTEVNDQNLKDMSSVVDQGVTSFKLFTAYPGVLMSDDPSIFQAMRRAGEIGGLIGIHAENGPAIDVLVREAIARGETAPKYHAITRPSALEGEPTHRMIVLAQLAKVPVYIVHLTCQEALDEVTAARDRGYKVYAETCPQYVVCSTDDIGKPGFEGAKYVCSPPMRDKSNWPHLWRGLRSNDLQVVATDHCSFNMAQKEMGLVGFNKIPNGMPGIENRLHVMWEHGVVKGEISPNRFVEICSTNPASIFGMEKKGRIAVGADADIVVWDPNRKHTISAKTHLMNVDYSAYEGWQVSASPRHVLVRGKQVVADGKYVGQAGDGQFVKRGRV